MIVVGCALAVALAACQQSEEGSSASGRNRFGYRGSADENSTKFATPTPTPDPYATPTPPVEETAVVSPTMPTPTPAPTTATPAREMAYGTPVPGKPGFVTSPHSPYAGYVDVRGFPPGTEVKCPYSGKIFLVP